MNFRIICKKNTFDIDEEICVGKSLTQIWKTMGPQTDPCQPPLITGKKLEITPSKATALVRLINNFLTSLMDHEVCHKQIVCVAT